MTTWTDLYRSIRDTGEINWALIRALATQKADAEMRAWRDMGMPRPWETHFREALTMTIARARTILDNELAMRERTRLSASEQLARTAELNAELAETAIPPRRTEAKEWRAEAAAVRRSKFRVVS